MSDWNEFYSSTLEKMYIEEHERKRDFEARLSIPSGLIIVIMSVVWYLLKSIKTLKFDSLHIVFYVFLIALLLLLAFSVYSLIRAGFNYTYGFAMRPNDFKYYHDKLVVHYTKHAKHYKLLKSADIAKAAELKLKEQLADQYRRAAQINRKANNRKSGFLHKANTFIVLTVLVLPLAAGTFLTISFQSKSPQQASVSKCYKENSCMVESSNSCFGISPEQINASDARDPEPAPDPDPEAELPEPPPIELIKEGEVKDE